MQFNIPANWKYIKLDLFNNASDNELVANKNKYAVTLNILTDSTTQYLRFTGKFNSPNRHVRRGVARQWAIDPHYQIVQQLIDELDGTTYKVSKFYTPDRKTATGLTGFLIIAEEGYQFILVYKTHVMKFEFTNRNLSDKQRRTGIIGTCSYSATKFNSSVQVKASDLLD